MECESSEYCGRTETLVRVKDPLRFLWPVCGCLVMVIYHTHVFFRFFFGGGGRGWTHTFRAFIKIRFWDYGGRRVEVKWGLRSLLPYLMIYFKGLRIELTLIFVC